jgi:hypothetical protein
MHNSIKVVVISMVVAGAGFAQEQQQPTQPPPPPPVPVAEQSVLPSAPLDRSFGVHTGINVGLLELDGQVGHLYGFASSALGIPLLSNGSTVVGALGIGYTVQLSSGDGSGWYFDLFGEGQGGKLLGNSHAAIGMGVGLRYLHRSGFTMGFKLPVFGMSVGDASKDGNGQFSGPASLGNYYLGYLCSQAPLTLGFRF